MIDLPIFTRTLLMGKKKPSEFLSTDLLLCKTEEYTSSYASRRLLGFRNKILTFLDCFYIKNICKMFEKIRYF